MSVHRKEIEIKKKDLKEILPVVPKIDNDFFPKTAKLAS